MSGQVNDNQKSLDPGGRARQARSAFERPGGGSGTRGLSILRLQRLIVDHSDDVARRLDDLTHSPHPSQAPASASKAVGEKALNRGDGRHGTFVQSPRTGPEG